MKNKEKYLDEIMQLVIDNKTLCVSKDTNELIDCDTCDCDECLFDSPMGCSHKGRKEWLDAEYVEETKKQKVTNYEAYKEDIMDAMILVSTSRDADAIVFDETNKRVSTCDHTNCVDCLFRRSCTWDDTCYEDDDGRCFYDKRGYRASLRKWLNEEFKG